MISYYYFSFIWTEKLKRILISCRLPKVSYTLAVYEDLTEMCRFSLDLLRCTKVSLETRSQLRSSQALWLVHFLWEFAVCRCMQRIRVVFARPMVGFLPSTSHPMVTAGVLFSWTALWPGPQTTDADSHRCAQVQVTYLYGTVHTTDAHYTDYTFASNQGSLALIFPALHMRTSHTSRPGVLGQHAKPLGLQLIRK